MLGENEMWLILLKIIQYPSYMAIPGCHISLVIYSQGQAWCRVIPLIPPTWEVTSLRPAQTNLVQDPIWEKFQNQRDWEHGSSGRVLFPRTDKALDLIPPKNKASQSVIYTFHIYLYLFPSKIDLKNYSNLMIPV
jgi:hypothetical protein